MPNGSNGVISFIGVGSNIDHPRSQCEKAIELLSKTNGCSLLRKSSFFKTEPVGFLDQEWFINAVLEIRTSLSPHQLLNELQRIETMLGRKRTIKWGPRIIDLDILLYGQDVVMDDDLIIPHPEMHKRRFVLEPLNEIAPYTIHPAYGLSISGLLQRLQDTCRVEAMENRLV